MKHIGLFIGRFQPFHNGHLMALKEIEKILLNHTIITTDLKTFTPECEIIIVVGNNQEIDYRHWWTFEEVKKMIEPCLQGFKIPIRIEYIPDLNDPPNYEEYILKKLNLDPEEVDLTVFSGNPKTLECFSVWRYQLKENSDFLGYKHGTEIRLMMAYEHITGEPTNWEQYVPEPVRDLGPFLLSLLF
jgi:nicotinamide mononucleotide adenylyltransferase